MKLLKYLGMALGVAVIVALAVWLLRTDPIGPLSGKRLSGEARAFSGIADAVDEHGLCAVETRPDDPHSVTTLCFMQGGRLVIPIRAEVSKRQYGNNADLDLLAVELRAVAHLPGESEHE